MDRNTIIGFALMAVVFLGFSYYMQPSAEEIQAQQQATTTQTTNAQTTLPQASLANVDSTALFFTATQGEKKELTLKNDVMSVTISTQGGQISAVRLNKYKDQQGQTITLFDNKENAMNFVLPTNRGNINTKDLYFTPIAQTDTSVVMQIADATGATYSVAYALQPNNYMVDIEVKALQMGALVTPNATLGIEWTQKQRQQEKGYDFEHRYATLTYKYADESSSDYLSALETDSLTAEQPVDWITFKTQYFSSVLIAYPNFSQVKMHSQHLDKDESNAPIKYLKNYHATFNIGIDPTGAKATRMQMYFGPNKYLDLKAMDQYAHDGKELQLESLVDLGWPLFRWINQFFTVYVFDWLTGFGLPMGIVLLLITILLRIIVYPTTRKSFMSSVRMRVLKPKMEALNAKYPKPEDAMRKQQEMMAIYSQYGVSPMGGCLPMLIQMPIWIAMFNFLPNAIELRQESFLWANDLSTYDDIISWGFHIPGVGSHLSIFCLLFCVSNVVYTWMNMRMQKDTMMGAQNEQMKIMTYMMYAMPVMFFFMFNTYSSGLNYYYFLSLITGALTMWYLRKTVDEGKVLAKLEAYYEAHKNDPKKQSGLAARLAAMQEQIEAERAKQQR